MRKILQFIWIWTVGLIQASRVHAHDLRDEYDRELYETKGIKPPQRD